jgi:hypothetical protein
MMNICNSKERTLDEWKEVFTAADSRLQLKRVIPLTRSALSVMELELAA